MLDKEIFINFGSHLDLESGSEVQTNDPDRIHLGRGPHSLNACSYLVPTSTIIWNNYITAGFVCIQINLNTISMEKLESTG